VNAPSALSPTSSGDHEELLGVDDRRGDETMFDGGGWWVIFPIIGLVFMLLMMSRMFGFRRRSSDRGMGPRIPRTPGLAMPETQQPLRAGGGG
jgi:hypothetical protein